MLRSSFLRSAGLLAVALTIVGVIHASASIARPADGLRLDVQYVRSAGTTFAYAEFGSGTPLLLLNGTGSPMNEWDPLLLAELEKSHRVIVFDYPGLGLSGSAPGRWTFANAADWVSQFAAAVSPNRPVNVLGWSMGGFIGQQLALRHPSQVHALVLAATNPGGPRTQLGPAWVQRLDSNSDEGDQAYLKTNYPATKLAQTAGRAFLDRLTRAVDSGAYPVERVPMSTYQAMVDAEDPWLRSGVNLQALGSLGPPALVMTGAEDVVTPPANSRLMAGRIPRGTLRLVPAAGHSFMFQNPARTARTIDAFLAAA